MLYRFVQEQCWVRRNATRELVLGLILACSCLCTFSHDINEESHEHTPTHDNTRSTADQVEPDSTEFTRQVLPLDVRVYEKLIKFQELLEAHETDSEKLSDAQKILDEILLDSDYLNATELGWIHRCYTMIAHEINDSSMLIEHFTKLLDYREGIEYEHEVEALEKLSQLLYADEKHDEALDYVHQLLHLNDTNIPGTILMAQIHLDSGNVEKANKRSRTAIDLMHKEKTSVDESSWTKLLFVVEELEDWNLAVDVLETMVVELPRKQYWNRLGELYTQLGNSEKAAEAFDFASEIEEGTEQRELE
ncbi:MAG: hypothetical protein OXG88_11260 [Gammaproteobacteria bacterium]|nr:hypothetical protein [Gammaproteobacteria bacterium]